VLAGRRRAVAEFPADRANCRIAVTALRGQSGGAWPFSADVLDELRSDDPVSSVDLPGPIDFQVRPYGPGDGFDSRDDVQSVRVPLAVLLRARPAARLR